MAIYLYRPKPRCVRLIEDLCEYKEKSIFDMVGVRPSRQRAPTFGTADLFSHQSFSLCPFLQCNVLFVSLHVQVNHFLIAKISIYP